MSDNNQKSGKTGRSANMTYADKALLIDLALKHRYLLAPA